MTDPGPDALIAEDAEAVCARLGQAIAALRGKTLLVTGASGMLASALVHAVVRANRTVLRDAPCHILANVRRPVDPAGPMGHLLSDPQVTFLQQDARDPVDWTGRIDHIVHAASAASPRHYMAQAVETLQVNSVGLNHLLERARAQGCERFLFVSSGEIYGTPPETAVPTPETFAGSMDPLAPRSCYAEGKRFGEALACHFHRQFGVPAVIARPFQVHGPGLRLGDGRAFADFLEAALRGEPIVLLSAGTARRTYCSLRDAAVALIHVLLDGQPGEAYNIGTSAPEVTILDLAHLIADLSGSGSRVEVRGDGAAAHALGSPARTCPDVTKLEREFGWRAEDSLETGLRRTLAWLRLWSGR